MQKINGGLIVFAIVAAAVGGLMFSGLAARRDPAVIAAIAEQERAKAAKLNAQADVARAAADRAQVDAQAQAAALPAIVASIRMTALGVGIAVVIATVGIALAVVILATTRAITIYPNANGQWPIIADRRRGGALLLVDTSRALGPVMLIGADGVKMPLPASEESALQLATQAQASTTMIGIAARSDGPMSNVTERVQQGAKALPAPTFDNVRLVYVKNGGQTKAQREMQDLEEIIRIGWVTGLQRSRWLNKSFSGTGNRIGRSYYDTIMQKLQRAGLIEDRGGDGWAPLIPVDEALDAFGLAHGDKDAHQTS